MRIVAANGGGARLDGRADLVAPEVLVRDLDTDPLRGLGQRAAGDRLERWGRNELVRPRPEPLVRRALRHMLEPMAALLIAAAALAGFVLGERLDAIAILAIVVLNTVIAIVQEGRAARALDALRAMETSVATVVRDGRQADLPAHTLVVGDVVVLHAGDRVPADVRLLEAAGLEADESLLTGESMAVTKSATARPQEHAGIAERRAMAFDGTLLTRGSGRGVVVATGMGTELGAIAGRIEERARPTPLQRQLRTLAVRIGIATGVIAVVVTGLLVVRGGASRDVIERAVLVGVALAVAAVPEGLAAVTTVTLALGTKRMAQQGGIVRRLPAVETLGATTVLAIDKTGTLTENRMHVRGVVVDGGLTAPAALAGSVSNAFALVAALCNDAVLETSSGDPLELALLAAVGPSRVDELRSGAPRVATVPFDAQTRRMTTVHRTDDAYTVVTKGAPEAVTALCRTSLAIDGRFAPLDRDAVVSSTAALAAQGYRTLALALRSIPSFDGDVDAVLQDMALVGIVVLEDPIRPEAAAAVRSARSAGMRVVMVTGDHPATGSTVARAVGLADDRFDVRTGAELRANGLPDDPLTVAVYARVDPDQKLEIVDALQRAGHVVAVTGDGVNDAPALRRADIGVALGRSGTDVARGAADLVLTDDNLATMVAAIREGRGIYANIRKLVDYLLACNLSEVLTVMIAIVLFPEVGVPLLPLQLLWMNLVTDGLPALALGVDPNDPAVMTVAPRPRDEPLLGPRRLLTLLGRAGVLAVASIAVLAVVRFAIGHPWTHARAAMFTTLVWTQLLHVFSARRLDDSLLERVSPFALIRSIAANPKLAGASAAGALLQAGVVLWQPAGRIFGTTPFGGLEWLVVATAAALAALCVAALPPLRPRSRGGGMPRV